MKWYATQRGGRRGEKEIKCVAHGATCLMEALIPTRLYPVCPRPPRQWLFYIMCARHGISSKLLKHLDGNLVLPADSARQAKPPISISKKLAFLHIIQSPSSCQRSPLTLYFAPVRPVPHPNLLPPKVMRAKAGPYAGCVHCGDTGGLPSIRKKNGMQFCLGNSFPFLSHRTSKKPPKANFDFSLAFKKEVTHLER